jgi:hypothetical protein
MGWWGAGPVALVVLEKLVFECGGGGGGASKRSLFSPSRILLSIIRALVGTATMEKNLMVRVNKYWSRFSSI